MYKLLLLSLLMVLVLTSLTYSTTLSVSPSTLTFRTGSQTQFTVVIFNSASVSVSYYIIVRTSDGSFVTQTPYFSVPANSTAGEPVEISGYNPNPTNLSVSYNITVYSAEDTALHSSIILPAVIQPSCPPGPIYVNNTNCQPETKSCSGGYYWDNATNYCESYQTLHPTLQQTSQQNNNNSGGGLFLAFGKVWFIEFLLVIIVLVFLIAFFIFRHGGGRIAIYKSTKNKRR